MTDVVVIGAGISGLSAAHWLSKQGLSVLVLEQDKEVGGTMKSIYDQGFMVETGPHSALETTPLIQELVRDCNLEEELVYANPVSKNRFILRDGKLQALPMSPGSFLRSSLFSVGGKIRLLGEPLIGRAREEESIAEFVVRRLGREFLDYAVDPFISGVYAGRPESLSVRAALPKLYALEERYGGLIKGMLKGRKERAARQEKTKDRARSFSFLSGMQTLPKAIARKLADRVLCNASVVSVALPENGNASERTCAVAFELEGERQSINARVVVLAVPAYAAAQLIRPFSEGAAQTLSTIRYAPVVSVYLGYRRSDLAHPLDGFGFLVPKKEGRNILGCLWSSSSFPNRAPAEMVSLTAFVGGDRQPELTKLNDQEMADLVISELKNLMQMSGNHVYLKTTRWKRAIPQYEKGHLQKMEALDAFESQYPHIVCCSNYRGGISVGDCIAGGHGAAERIYNLVKRRIPPQGN